METQGLQFIVLRVKNSAVLSWPCFLFFNLLFPAAQSCLPSSFFSLNTFFILLVTASFLKLSSFWVSAIPLDFLPTSNLFGCYTSSNPYLKWMFPRIPYLVFLSSYFRTHLVGPFAWLNKQPLKITSKSEFLAQSFQSNPKHPTLVRISLFECVPQALQISLRKWKFSSFL